MFSSGDILLGEVYENLQAPEEQWRALEFEDCSFRGGDLSGARWTELTFLDTRFEGVDLSNLVLRGCRFRGCSFQDCKLLGVDWTQGNGLEGLCFRGCRLDYGNFAHQDLSRGEWVDCSARETHLVGADLSHCDCSGTSFLGSTFSGTDLSHTDLRSAQDYVVDPRTNTLAKTRVSLPEAVSLLRGLDILLEE